MPQLINGDNLYGTITVTKQSGTKVYLQTKKTYVEKKIELDIDVQGGSAVTPGTTITANPTITVSDTGLITASNSASQSITPTVSAGYVSSGTAGTVSVSGSSTYQLPVATVAETKAYLGILD